MPNERWLVSLRPVIDYESPADDFLMPLYVKDLGCFALQVPGHASVEITMTAPTIILDGVSIRLADGRTILRDINLRLDQRPTAIVGRNGVGKTTLARVLAGLQPVTHGRRSGSGVVHYVPQQPPVDDNTSLGQLAGLGDVLAAADRIEAGAATDQDFSVMEGQWDIANRLRRALDRYGLSRISMAATTARLSGGEASRVQLAGAFLRDADILILDEPTNHLDLQARMALMDSLSTCKAGVTFISHDRALLKTAERIIEVRQSGVNSFDCGFDAYEAIRAEARASAERSLHHQHAERTKFARSIQKQRARVDQRLARGHRAGRTSNQARILLGLKAARAEKSHGAALQRLAAHKQLLDARVQETHSHIDHEPSVSLHKIELHTHPHRVAATLSDVTLPHVAGPQSPISLVIAHAQRIAVLAPNGRGKSTLLKIIAGERLPRSGIASTAASVALVDQHGGRAPPDTTILETLLQRNRHTPESELRTKLDHLGLDQDTITQPLATLSGGERLKGAIACALYGEHPPELLLLDEPNNHLDLPSLRALEALLCDYRGGLMVVSHDLHFLSNIQPTHCLQWVDHGWRLSPY